MYLAELANNYFHLKAVFQKSIIPLLVIKIRNLELGLSINIIGGLN